MVIGGAGFIGSHLVDQLCRTEAAEILIYDNFCRGTRENLSTALRDPRVKVFPLGGDILRRDLLEEAMRGMDGVFHLAALWLLHCHDYPESAFEVNIRGTFNVIQACLKAGVRRMVFSSSASVYGDAVKEPMTEDHPYNNRTFYGATKIAGEHMLRSLRERYHSPETPFEFVGLRYMNVYGPRQDYRGAYIAVIMKMLDRLDRGLPPLIYGDGSQAYDFVYVEDVAEANIEAMKADVSDRFYNVGTGVRTTIRALTDTLLELTGSFLHPEFRVAGTTFVKNRIGCPEAARQELGFTARTALSEGLRKLIAWRAAHIDRVGCSREESTNG